MIKDLVRTGRGLLDWCCQLSFDPRTDVWSVERATNDPRVSTESARDRMNTNEGVNLSFSVSESHFWVGPNGSVVPGLDPRRGSTKLRAEV